MPEADADFHIPRQRLPCAICSGLALLNAAIFCAHVIRAFSRWMTAQDGRKLFGVAGRGFSSTAGFGLGFHWTLGLASTFGDTVGLASGVGAIAAKDGSTGVAKST